MLPRSALARSLQLQRGVAARFYSEGSTGTPKGSGSEDSFVKRERATEDFFVRQREKEQLRHLKEQLEKQRKKIDSLENKIDSMTK